MILFATRSLILLLSLAVLLLTSCGTLSRLNRAETDLERFYELGDAAQKRYKRGDYAQAKAHALELESLAPKFKGNFYYPRAYNSYHVMLGRLALREGNKAEALAYLRKAAQTPPGISVSTFGPNLSLARDLLLAGEQEAVIKHLQQVRSFWGMVKLTAKAMATTSMRNTSAPALSNGREKFAMERCRILGAT